MFAGERPHQAIAFDGWYLHRPTVANERHTLTMGGISDGIRINSRSLMLLTYPLGLRPSTLAGNRAPHHRRRRATPPSQHFLAITPATTPTAFVYFRCRRRRPLPDGLITAFPASMMRLIDAINNGSR